MNKLFILPIIAVLLFTLAACTNTSSSEKGALSKTDAAKKIDQFKDNKELQSKNITPPKEAYKAKGRMMDLPTTDGVDARAYINAPKGNKGKVLFVFHDKWGINDHIKEESDRLADNLGDVMIVALDLYDGSVTDTPSQANLLTQTVKAERIKTIISSGMGLSGSGAHIATLGWGFGGHWSLKAAAMLGSQGIGCVMYYGMPVQNAVDLAPIRAEVLAIFAKEDNQVSAGVVTNFIDNCKISRTNLIVKSYDADHSFVNPSSPTYNEAITKAANAEVIKFLKSKF